MQKYIFSFFLFVFSFTLSAQDLKRVQKTLDTLCHETFFGRGYLQQGDKKASQYLAQRFKEIGVKPFQETYFQPFEMAINTFPETPTLQIGKTKLMIGKDFIINALSSSGFGSGKIYQLDERIFTENKNQSSNEFLGQFLNTKLSDKVLVFDGDLESKFSEMPRSFFQKMAEAKAHIKLKTKLTALVATQCYPDFYPPIFEVLRTKFPKKVQKIIFSVRSEFISNYGSQNVIGYLDGTRHSDSVLVITAHYDHLGGQGKTVYFAGANDNASGVSMLLEFAEYYKKNPLKYKVVFLLFGAEEAGLIGSKFYTENPIFPLSNIKFLVNLDLVGTGDEGATVVNASIHQKEFKILTKINENQQLLPKIQMRGRAANSDHYFFSQQGVPAFFIYTLGGIQAYHDIHDQSGTLPLTKYTELFQLIRQFLEQL